MNLDFEVVIITITTSVSPRNSGMGVFFGKCVAKDPQRDLVVIVFNKDQQHSVNSTTLRTLSSLLSEVERLTRHSRRHFELTDNSGHILKRAMWRTRTQRLDEPLMLFLHKVRDQRDGD